MARILEEHTIPHARHLRPVTILLALLFLLAGAGAQTLPTRPMEGEFIIDEAGLIQPAEREQIKRISAALLKERGNPIIVVTIPSLAKYGAFDVESYALAMFNAWGIGTKVQSKGILLLVAVEDRKARIELGEGYANTKDDVALEIMREVIVPSFKQGNYSAGILQGVEELDQMARGRRVRTGPAWQSWLFLGLLALGTGVAVSLIASGKKGWGWGLLGVIVAVVVGMLLSGGSGRSSGTSFGGSSFGGGRGGGGGATGSW